MLGGAAEGEAARVSVSEQIVCVCECRFDPFPNPWETATIKGQMPFWCEFGKFKT